MADKKKENTKSKPKKFQRSSNNNRFYILLLIAYTFLIYSNSIGNDYALDDKVVIVKNIYVQKGFVGIKNILTEDTFAGFFKEDNLVAGGRYRPLSLVTFAIENQLFGKNPGVSHFINVMLYSLTGVIIFLLLKRLLINQSTKYSSLIPLPFVTALLFLSLPVHTEAVANIKGRDEILSLLFSLIAANEFLKYFDGGKKMKNLFIGSLCLFLGLLSKENAITFLLIIPMMIWFFRKTVFKELISVTASVIAVSGLFLLMRQLFSDTSLQSEITELMNNPFLGMTVSEKYATILFTFGKYFSLLLLPVTLTHDYYPYQIATQNFSSIGTIVSLLACLLLLAIAFMQLRKRTILSFNILYFFITFSVVSNLVFPVGTFMSERFLYMPSLGFCLLVGYFISLLPFYNFNTFPFTKSNVTEITTKNFFSSGIIRFILLVVIGGYSLKTIFRNPAWENDFVLYSTDVTNSPNSAMAHSGLASEYQRKAEKTKNPIEKKRLLNLAIDEYKMAIQIYPEFSLAYYDLGMSYYSTNNLDSAESSFRKSASINPNNIDAQTGIGFCLMQRGETDSAIAFYNTLIKKDSTHWRPYVNIGACYLKQRDYDKASFCYEKALALNPNNSGIVSTLEDIRAMQGR